MSVDAGFVSQRCPGGIPDLDRLATRRACAGGWVWTAFVWCGALWCGASSARADDIGRTIGAVGGGEILWAYRDLTDGVGADRLWRFAYHELSSEGRARWWRPWGVAGAVGDVTVVASCGGRLHVWYGDGTRRFYGRRRSGVGLALPDSAVPLAAAGDAESGVLYAVVYRSVALALEPDGARAGESDAAHGMDAGEADADEDEALVEVAPRWLESKYVLVRLEGGKWRGDRGVPEGFDPKGDAWLMAAGGTVGVLWRERDGDRYRLSRSEGPVADWSAAVGVDELDEGEIVAARMVGGRIDLVVVRGADDVASMWRDWNGEWVTGAAHDWNDVGRGADQPRAFGVIDKRAVGVWVTDGGIVETASWDVESGALLAERETVRALCANTLAQSLESRRVMLSYALLLSVLAAVYLRRRRSVIEAVELPSRLRLAGHGRRILAFGIDAALFYPCAALMYAPLLSEYGLESVALRQAFMADSAFMSAFIWRWVGAVCGFIAYATVCEALWGATAGKRLARIRVVDERGARCGFSRIFARNALRSVEFYPFLDLVPTLVLIVLTKNRQRLGDLIGGTLVVEEVPKNTNVDEWA